MPHLTIEYTANLDQRLNVPEMINTLHSVAEGIDAFLEKRDPKWSG